MTWEQRCQSIEIILSDVDGVLTDGRIGLDNQGIESKWFHARDGLGIRLWQKTGYPFGLVTGRSSQVVRNRAIELQLEIVRQGVDDKLATVDQILEPLNLKRQQVCYLGDDLLDLPVVQAVGLGVAVADACAELRQTADYVTSTRGGHGAVREVIELILKAQRRWDVVIQPYKGA